MRILPDKWKKAIEWAARILAVAIFLAGVYIAYLILHVLATPEKVVPIRKDTTFVKVINLGSGLDTALKAIARGQATKSKPDSSRTLTPGPLATGEVFSRPGPYGQNTSAGTNPRQPFLSQAVLDSSYVKNGGAARFSGLSFGRILNFCFCIIFLIVCIIVVYRFEPLDLKEFRDRDPGELKAAFEVCKNRILAMGNPRRIKRFSNKVRFHYYYLRTRYAGGTRKFVSGDISDMVRILLYLEDHHELMNIDGLPGAEAKDNAWFVRTVVDKVPDLSRKYSASDDIVLQLFELNKDIIV
jgi:hypothetical protein